MMTRDDLKISELLGKTLNKIDGDRNSDEIIFHTTDGHTYRMHHDQDCCESVTIEDIAGDLQDLLHTPITRAEEPSSLDGFDSSKPSSDFSNDSFSWTFYILGTNKGTVTLRWFGSSNGYYSEKVNFDEVDLK